MATASRRLLLKSYRAWLEADEAFRLAQRRVADLVPSARQHLFVHIGNRGSKVRQLYNARQKALETLLLARQQVLKEREARTLRLQTQMLLVYRP
ncbi:MULTISPECIES: hypothetical protein [Roseobacteraceae]|uniref:hypothetical protein n=1 Tax=Roseobacteraceae TaxID=2854170 RepID=UPI00080AACA5|nr:MULTISPECIES: hypothetical protein [Roseobacteraceae]ANT62562.1 hypothetical protein AYJ57_19435 [Salipiger sp. CCB-MM3]MCA0996730.1 hypothetical protein [Alloyangia pacifica]NDV99956.1 hypothetical protein [Salipiger sp. PrR002]NDW56251.1 hypothetical protein [Salipiger sp. PrR004]